MVWGDQEQTRRLLRKGQEEMVQPKPTKTRVGTRPAGGYVPISATAMFPRISIATPTGFERSPSPVP